MSIAVSIVIKPSRLLALLVYGVCVCAGLVGVLLWFGVFGESLDWLRRLCGAITVLLSLGSGFYVASFLGTTYHLDISGTGQIRLRIAVPKADRQPVGNPSVMPHKTAGETKLVILQTNSTLWPHFLLLRLRGEDDCLYVVPIMYDCISGDAFRGISVACRWISGHRFSQ